MRHANIRAIRNHGCILLFSTAITKAGVNIRI